MVFPLANDAEPPLAPKLTPSAEPVLFNTTLSLNCVPDAVTANCTVGSCAASSISCPPTGGPYTIQGYCTP